MKLIVGLGNPGKEYQKSKHNVGFMAADLLVKKLELDAPKTNAGFKAAISSGEWDGQKVIICKPLTFMNLSGEAVQKVAHYYKIKSGDILVIYDDLDLPLGKIRIRKSGGPGTHNGMKSVTQMIGESFPRIRIGIETRTEAQIQKQDAASYVLAGFAKNDLPLLEEALDKAIKASLNILSDDLDAAMNKFN